MKRSTKAALLSGLVFPGLGHLFLKRYLLGIVLICLAAWPVYSMIKTTAGIALEVAEEIETGLIPADPASLQRRVAERTQEVEGPMRFAGWALFAIWVIGIADSLRIGSAQERLEAPPAAPER